MPNLAGGSIAGGPQRVKGCFSAERRVRTACAIPGSPATDKTKLAPGLVERDRHGVRKIQAATGGLHRQA